jgi:hypothetical protein
MMHGATLGGFAVKAAIERAGIDDAEVDDVMMGSPRPKARPAATSRARARCAPACRSAPAASWNRKGKNKKHEGMQLGPDPHPQPRNGTCHGDPGRAAARLTPS